MASALRIHGTVYWMLNGVYDPATHHIDILRDYQAKNDLTDESIDAMIETGDIEFGEVVPSGRGKPTNDFMVGILGNTVYKSIDKMIEINGDSTLL